jgi:hypothetical protein
VIIDVQANRLAARNYQRLLMNLPPIPPTITLRRRERRDSIIGLIIMFLFVSLWGVLAILMILRGGL